MIAHFFGSRLIPAVVFAACFLAGCSPSLWQSEYRAVATAPPLPTGGTVVLREVPWERVQRTLEELRAEVEASDIHPDEWPAERRSAADAKLLRALQVSGDPSSVEILGRSVFRTTSRTRPDDGELSEFARRIGATMVVWSSKYLGKTETVVQEPLTEYVTETGSGYRDRHGVRRSDSYTRTSTLWVPVRVSADENAWMAFFLREVP